MNDCAGKETSIPTTIEVRGARVNNLNNIDVDIPLHQFVSICGVSGSGKSSLAMGVLYAEGARRYLETLSTYTRRRIEQAPPPEVDSIRFLPSALALRQRPNVPGVRSTVGTISETLNVLRLMYSRLGSHVCPCGHRVPPSLSMAQTGKIVCPQCSVKVNIPSAEAFAFNSEGACPACHGTGEVVAINPDTLIGDQNKTIRDGAVAGWRIPGGVMYPLAAQQLGVRVDIPFKDLTDKEIDVVLHSKPCKISIGVNDRKDALEVNYFNAHDAVMQLYNKTESENNRSRLNKFFRVSTCPTCKGTRFAPQMLDSLIAGKNIAEVSCLTLEELMRFTETICPSLPREMNLLSEKLVHKLQAYLQPLILLGLDYLSLDRNGNTLSTGELQRLQLSRTLRNETTGVLYVLDEPSIGLHPANMEGLFDVFYGLVSQGNSLIVVDHDIDVLSKSEYLIELGPGAGRMGGTVLSTGSVKKIADNKHSLIGPYLKGTAALTVRQSCSSEEMFGKGCIHIEVSKLHNLQNIQADFPVGRLTVVTGLSGAGKTALVLDSVIPAIEVAIKRKPLPAHVKKMDRAGIQRVVAVDAVPIGKNERSTVATYSGIFDHVRELFAATDAAVLQNWDAGHFSHNTKGGVCETCGGTGRVSVDVQFLPDIDLTCPVCKGKRYNNETLAVKWKGYSIYDILSLTLENALNVFHSEPAIYARLEAFVNLGLGYLTLGEATPLLSGGEAQRLKLVSEMGKIQKGTLFVFDEPTTGLHPQDIRTLIKVFDALQAAGGTIIAIEHDLDLIAHADYVIDMGPRGGVHGGHITASGTPAEICSTENSLTGRYLTMYLQKYRK